MKVLLLSDVHGNLDALESVLSESEKYKWKELWFLGDLAGYGPEPDKCYDLLKSYNLVFIPGNHDLYLAGKLERNRYSMEALRALIITGPLLKKDFRDVISALPLHQKRKGITLVHGSPKNPSTDYILCEENARDSFDLFRGSCCLFGHTHRQGYFIKSPSGNTSWHKPEPGNILQYKGSRILLNPGSVGQPRDYDPRASWAILDTGKKEVQFFRTPYDIEKTQNKMKAIGLSEFLIRRLERGE